MDHEATMHYISHYMNDEDKSELTLSMFSKLSDDQLRECLRTVLMKRYESYSDVEQIVSSGVEWSWNDTDYYDDAYGDDIDENVECHIKDGFYSIVAMMDADLMDDALEVCRMIEKALDEASKNPKYTSYSQVLMTLRDQMSDALKTGNPRPWFDY